MDVFEAIKERRSVRAYGKEEVSEKDVETLIKAARWAPSAGNIQPWEFIIVTDTKIRERLGEAALQQNFIEEAPVIIVVCANEGRSNWNYGSRGANLYCIQDTAAATQNMLLAAHALGLGACWIGAFNEGEVRRVLNIPGGVRPVAMVPVGHPAEKPRAPPRRSMMKNVHYETFRGATLLF